MLEEGLGLNHPLTLLAHHERQAVQRGLLAVDRHVWEGKGREGKGREGKSLLISSRQLTTNRDTSFLGLGPLSLTHHSARGDISILGNSHTQNEIMDACQNA